MRSLRKIFEMLSQGESENTPSGSNDAAISLSLEGLASYIAPNMERAIPIVKAIGIQGRLENLARNYSISQRPSTGNSSTCTLDHA